MQNKFQVITVMSNRYHEDHQNCTYCLQHLVPCFLGTTIFEALVACLVYMLEKKKRSIFIFHQSLFSENLFLAAEELTGCFPTSPHLLPRSVAPILRPPWTAPPWRTSGVKWRASRRAVKMDLKKQRSWSSNLLTVST